MDEKRLYDVEFKASGKVTVEAESEDEARARAVHDVLIPGLWFEDFPIVTINSIVAVASGKEKSGRRI